MTKRETDPGAGSTAASDTDDATSAVATSQQPSAPPDRRGGGASHEEGTDGAPDGSQDRTGTNANQAETPRSETAPSGPRVADEGFTRHMHRRKVANYERSLARSAYAYGVDLRRSTWLARSSIGEIMLRSLDRRWPSLAKELTTSCVRMIRHGESLPLLLELERSIALLRAPAPTLWLLREDAPDRMQWPIVTALGAQHGDVRWLIVDHERLDRLTSSERLFELAAGLSHLQNDHGALLSAHLLAAREGTLRRVTLRAGLYPWSQVMAFSSDRAGLIRLGALAPALVALRRTVIAEGICPWYPQTATVLERERALEDFARTDVFARLCAARRSHAALAQGEQDLSIDHGAADGSSETLDAQGEHGAGEEQDPLVSNHAPKGAPKRRSLIPGDAWSLAKADNRLTWRLGVY